MGFLPSLRVALECLAANKLRSLLTMLGVIIGVASVIVMVSIVEGARAQVLKELEGMGSRLVLVIFSGWERQRGGGVTHLEYLTLRDAEALRECPLVETVSPELPLDNTRFELDGRHLTGSLVGCQPEFAALHDIEIARGRSFSQEDCDAWAKVCVIGADVKDRLWPDTDPIGQRLPARGVDFTVIGVAARKGRAMGEESDKRVYAPLSTLQKRISGDKRVWVIWAQVTDVTRTEEAADQIWAVLMRRHNNQPDFTVDTQSRLLSTVNRILAIFGLVLGGIGGLSLLVGGIGIMNIMLVSVTERTREIGLRKAVGAKRRHILVQFLTEAMTLSGVGGLVGIGIGFGLSRLVEVVSRGNLHTAVPLWAAALGFAFSCGVGVFFGIYPAYRAARLDPIQALRHE